MKNILEQLYAGELVPAELKIEGNEEYETLCRRSLEEIENFTEKLDKENRKEFQNILDTYLELTYLEKRQSFCDGFRIGAGIMCEVFKEGPVELINKWSLINIISVTL